MITAKVESFQFIIYDSNHKASFYYFFTKYDFNHKNGEQKKTIFAL